VRNPLQFVGWGFLATWIMLHIATSYGVARNDELLLKGLRSIYLILLICMDDLRVSTKKSGSLFII